jgi:hypothetical protein
MNRYIRQFFSLLGTIFKQIIQRIFDRLTTRLHDRKPPQPDSPQREAYSFTEIARRAAAERETEQVEIVSTAKSSRNNERHCNKRRKSKRAKWAEEKSKQDSAYAEARANGDNQGIRDYWKWLKRYGASTKEYYARAKAKRKAAQKIAERNDRMISDEAKKRRAEIKADAQCELPENIMIEHLEDHRDGIGWSIAAFAKKKFYVRRTLKINDPNGDMFCEVDDNGEALLNAVKQLISEHDRSNTNQ